MTGQRRWRGLWDHLRRYLTVGVGSAVTDLTMLTILTHFAHWPAWMANLVSRPCGGLFSFIFNKVWTFGRREIRGTGAQLGRFWAAWLIAYALSELLVWAFSRFAEWGALPSKIAAEGIVNVANFLVLRHWTFRASGRWLSSSGR